MRSSLFTKLALAAAATAITLSPALADWRGNSHAHGHHGKVAHHHTAKHKHAGKHAHSRRSGHHHHVKPHHAWKYANHHHRSR